LIGSTLLAASLADKAKPHTLIEMQFGGLHFSINQFMFMSLVASVLVLLFLLPVSKKFVAKGDDAESYVVKGRVAQFFEAILVFLRDTMVRPHLGDLTDKYIPYIWTTFFIILFANLLGLMPIGQAVALAAWAGGAESAGPNGHYDYWQFWGGPAMANINITAALASVSLFMIICVGIKEGRSHFFAHFAPVPLWPIMDGAKLPMLPLALFLVVLEIVGLIIKACVLALRLFGNILAGFLVVSALVKLITDFGSLPVGVGVTLSAVAIMFLELFIAFLQTYIFTFLTVLFIASGAAHHGHEHPDEHPDELDYALEPHTNSGHHAH
jgi:F-type H+-transporting ATPase subunit a